LIPTTTASRVIATCFDGKANSYPLGTRTLCVGRADASPLEKDRGVGAGNVEAVTSAVVKKVAVATRDRRDRRDTPHKKCPLVQPEPSCMFSSILASRRTPRALDLPYSPARPRIQLLRSCPTVVLPTSAPHHPRPSHQGTRRSLDRPGYLPVQTTSIWLYPQESRHRRCQICRARAQ
jgi:hypothetical protein